MSSSDVCAICYQLKNGYAMGLECGKQDVSVLGSENKLSGLGVARFVGQLLQPMLTCNAVLLHCRQILTARCRLEGYSLGMCGCGVKGGRGLLHISRVFNGSSRHKIPH